MKGKKINPLYWSISDITETNITQKEMSDFMENYNICISDRVENTRKEYRHYIGS